MSSYETKAPEGADQGGTTALKATYRVADFHYEDLAARLEKLNRRAEKLGLPPVTVTVLARESAAPKLPSVADLSDDTELNPDDFGPAFDWLTIEVVGTTPKLGGWRFAGRIQHEETGNIFACLPGETIPEAYRHNKPACDHCKARRTRRDTFVVVHDDGRFMQVGRNCLKDFTGHADPQALAAWAEALEDFNRWASDQEDPEGWAEEGGARSGRGPEKISLVGFLVNVAAIMKTAGWVSRTTAREFDKAATADLALYNMERLQRRERSSWREKPPVVPTAADQRQAEEALAWIRAQKGAWLEGNEYRANLFYACQRDEIQIREAGLVASLLITHKKAVEADLEKQTKAKAQAPNSQHFGTVGKRGEFSLTLLALRPFDNDYGVRTLFKFADQAGNVATWWKSGAAGDVWEEGGDYRVKATVKAHEDYRGVPQTVLQRVTLVERVGAVCICEENRYKGYAGRRFVCPAHGERYTEESPEAKAERLAKEAAAQAEAQAEYDRKALAPTDDARQAALAQADRYVAEGVGSPEFCQAQRARLSDAPTVATLESALECIRYDWEKHQTAQAAIRQSAAAALPVPAAWADLSEWDKAAKVRYYADLAKSASAIGEDLHMGISRASWRAKGAAMDALLGWAHFLALPEDQKPASVEDLEAARAEVQETVDAGYPTDDLDAFLAEAAPTKGRCDQVRAYCRDLWRGLSELDNRAAALEEWAAETAAESYALAE